MKMTPGNKCISVLLFASMIVMLFVAIVVPIIVRSKVSDDVIAQSSLVLETAQEWGQVPGTRNIKNLKNFIIYNITSTPTEVFSGVLNLQEIVLPPYVVNYTYENVQYAPNTNESLSYYNVFQHTYSGNESVLHQTQARTIDLGGMKAQYLLQSLTPTQLFVQTLSRIMDTYNNDIVPTIVTNISQMIFFHDQATVNNTVFMFNNTVTPLQSDQLWNDVDYGWSTLPTLKIWFNLAWQYWYAGPKNPYYSIPTNDPTVAILMSRFNLTYDQMNNLLGGQSMMAKVVQAIQGEYYHLINCMSFPCGLNQLFFFQFFGGNYLTTPFPGTTAFANISAFNTSFPVSPEPFLLNATAAGLFDITTAYNLFTPGTPNSLFLYSNVDLLLTNTPDLILINETFGLNSLDEAQFLVDYANFILNEFTFGGVITPQGQSLKAATDLTARAMNNLFGQMGALLAYNVTAIGVYNASLQQDLNCPDFFSHSDIVGNLSGAICSNHAISLDSVAGNSVWIQALLEGPGSPAWLLINNTINPTSAQMNELFDLGSPYFQLAQAVATTMSQQFNCVETFCRPTELAPTQWASNGIITNLPSQYFFTEDVTSLADIFPQVFCYIPEFYEFTTRVINDPTQYPQVLADSMYSFGQGSILNKFQLFSIGYYGTQGNFQAIANQFDLNIDTAVYLFNYTSYIYINGYLSPNGCGYTKVASLYELLWGWNSQVVEDLVNDVWYEAAQPADPRVSLAGMKNNTSIYQNLNPNFINSGASDINMVRQIYAYNGNTTLALNRVINNGYLNYTQWYLPWGESLLINGTDSMGFGPYLTSTQRLNIFEPFLMRNIEYIMQEDHQIGSESYDVYNYSMNPDMMSTNAQYQTFSDGFFNVTPIKNIPMSVSYPYFLGCDNHIYNNIRINGSSPSAYQGKYLPGNFMVEKLTGITFNYSKNYQYNLYYTNPFYPELGTYVVPLITVLESYDTPESQLDADLKGFYHSFETAYFVQIIGFIVAGLFFWAWLFYFIIVRKKGANFNKSDLERSSHKSKMSEYQSKLIHSNMIEEANENEENDDAPYSRLSSKGVK